MSYISFFILLPYLFLLSVIGTFKRKNYDTAHSLIYYFVILGFVAEVLMRFCASVFKNNIAVYNSVNLVEFLLLFSFYSKFLHKDLNRFVYVLVLGIFFSFYFFEISSNGFLTMMSYSFLYKNAILIFLALMAFRKIIRLHETTLISDHSFFWINCAVLIYYSCTLSIFGLRKYTVDLQLLNLVAIYLHLFFILVFYGLLSIGLWKTSKK